MGFRCIRILTGAAAVIGTSWWINCWRRARRFHSSIAGRRLIIRMICRIGPMPREEAGMRGGQLRGANRRPVGGVESQDNVLLSPVIAEFELLFDITYHRREFEMRQFIA